MEMENGLERRLWLLLVSLLTPVGAEVALAIVITLGIWITILGFCWLHVLLTGGR
jgi:hypothetical protein